MRGFIRNKIYIFIFGLLLIIGSVFVATDKFATATEEQATSETESEPEPEQVEEITTDTTDETTEQPSDAQDEVAPESEDSTSTEEQTPTEEVGTEQPASESENESEPENESLTATIGNAIGNIVDNIVDIVKKDEEPKEETPAPVVEPEVEEPKEKEEEKYEATRTYNKKIFVNKDAKHTCEAEFFKVDLSGRDSTTNTITLTKEADISYELEVGSIPDGFDIKFTDNKYEKAIGSEETSVDVEIFKKSNAPEGSYTIPFIYTQKGVFDSSVICQMNIVNL